MDIRLPHTETNFAASKLTAKGVVTSKRQLTTNPVRWRISLLLFTYRGCTAVSWASVLSVGNINMQLFTKEGPRASVWTCPTTVSLVVRSSGAPGHHSLCSKRVSCVSKGLNSGCPCTLCHWLLLVNRSFWINTLIYLNIIFCKFLNITFNCSYCIGKIILFLYNRFNNNTD